VLKVTFRDGIGHRQQIVFVTEQQIGAHLLFRWIAFLLHFHPDAVRHEQQQRVREAANFFRGDFVVESVTAGRTVKPQRARKFL
jgi:hypothetical protein